MNNLTKEMITRMIINFLLIMAVYSYQSLNTPMALADFWLERIPWIVLTVLLAIPFALLKRR